MTSHRTSRPRPDRLRILYRGHTYGAHMPLWSLEAKHLPALFATTDPYIAAEENDSVERLELEGDAKVLFFKKMPRIIRLNPEYDAIWFPDQELVGVAILNEEKIVSRSWITVKDDDE